MVNIVKKGLLSKGVFLLTITGVDFQFLDIGGGLSAAALHRVQAAAHNTFARSVGHGRLFGDQALFVYSDDVIIKGGHAERAGSLF